MTAYLIVRAEVPAGDRAAFDRWYDTEHLPDAHAGFRALSARRGWSDVTDGVHVAIYEFETLERAREISNSDTIRGLIAEFDRVWGDRVKRQREVVGIVQGL